MTNGKKRKQRMLRVIRCSSSKVKSFAVWGLTAVCSGIVTVGAAADVYFDEAKIYLHWK